MTVRRRLDRELVRRGLAPSREQAQTLIAADRVIVGGSPARKASRQVAPDEPVVVLGPPPRFVGRGGEKLAAALAEFGVPVAGRRALDAGASTGGFTDCLLQAGAASVVAVDVGRGQLHARLRADPRVEVRERTDIRRLDPAEAGAPFGIVVADLSFISLRAVLDALVGLGAEGTDWVLLVKPQFEAGRVEVSRGRGVIRDPSVRERALGEVSAAIRARGLGIMGVMTSPITGADGNVEYLVHATK
jgi:23S rRNA (cytidine1920-2'-O)/16S rRNA (cytidine1409-2'-O)-methyltransferase